MGAKVKQAVYYKFFPRTHSLVYEIKKPVGGWRGMGIGYILCGFGLM
jgi:hypothetical protein